MSSPSRPDGRPAVDAPDLPAGLRDVVEDFARHSRKNSEAIDVLVHALKAVHQELQQEKARTRVMLVRVKRVERSLARLTGVVDALRRQGWVQ